jgi:clan AA aspartic protease
MPKKIYTTLQIDTACKTKHLKAWVDTGFDKYLILPEKIAETIRLPIVKRVPVVLGNNKATLGAVGTAVLIQFVGETKLEIEAEVLVLPNESEPIIGISLLNLIYEQTNYNPLLDMGKEKLKFILAS